MLHTILPFITLFFSSNTHTHTHTHTQKLTLLRQGREIAFILRCLLHLLRLLFSSPPPITCIPDGQAGLSLNKKKIIFKIVLISLVLWERPCFLIWLCFVLRWTSIASKELCLLSFVLWEETERERVRAKRNEEREKKKLALEFFNEEKLYSQSIVTHQSWRGTVHEQFIFEV